MNELLTLDEFNTIEIELVVVIIGGRKEPLLKLKLLRKIESLISRDKSESDPALGVYKRTKSESEEFASIVIEQFEKGTIPNSPSPSLKTKFS